jgi:formiminotetrahydrofolate cyclodeaminase
MLVKLTVEEFCKELGSNSPAPGGGSVAALSGALGAELVAMVCGLSIGKKDLEPFNDLLAGALQRAQDLSKSLLRRVDLDTEAFNAVMAAFKMPKQTDAEKTQRSEAIQKGYIEAIQSPLGTARECREVLTIAESLIGKSNPNALSDLGVAAQQAYAGLEGAIMNVRINIPALKVEGFKSQTQLEIGTLLEQGRKSNANVYDFVLGNIGKG